MAVSTTQATPTAGVNARAVCFPTVDVFVLPNGGLANETGIPMELKLSDGPEGLYDIFDIAGRTFFVNGPKADRSLPVDVYTEEGVLLHNTSTVNDGQMLFLVPKLPQVFPEVWFRARARERVCVLIVVCCL